MYSDKLNQDKVPRFKKPTKNKNGKKSRRLNNRFLNNQSDLTVGKNNTSKSKTKSKSNKSKATTVNKLRRSVNKVDDVSDDNHSGNQQEEVVSVTYRTVNSGKNRLLSKKSSRAKFKQKSTTRRPNRLGTTVRTERAISQPVDAKQLSEHLKKSGNLKAKPTRGTKALQKKKIQKSYHSLNKESKLKTNSSSKKRISPEKIKDVGKQLMSAISNKGWLFVGAIVAVILLAIYLFVILFALLGSASDVRYIFDEKDASLIHQMYATEEVAYIEKIVKEAEEYSGDYNVTFHYDPVGHEPHEVLSLINVLLRYELAENEIKDYKLNISEVQNIIDSIIDARYQFSVETEKVNKFLPITDEDGNTTVEEIIVEETHVRSVTNSINNIVARDSYETPSTTAEFINAIKNDVIKVANDNDLYASVILAQAILETGNGKSELSSPPYFNLFGIKGSYNGESVNMITKEENRFGSKYTITDRFRDYPTYKESIEDYATVMREQPSKGFYAPTYKSNTNSYKDATAFLTGTYATDSSYGEKLNSIIESSNLTQYDNMQVGNTTESINVDNDDDKIEKIANGDVFALTEYERDLFFRTFAAKGMMGLYPSPVQGMSFDDISINQYAGIQWDKRLEKSLSPSGLALDVESGLNVQAQFMGKVTEISEYVGKAKVVIENEETITMGYGYLDHINVSLGSHVKRGDVIGKTSSLGLHLTTEDSADEEWINPFLIHAYEKSKLSMVAPDIRHINANTGTSTHNRLNENMVGQTYDEDDVQRLFDVGRKYIGFPYVFGGSSPGTSFDCSGFIYWVFKEAGLKNWKRTTANEIHNKHTVSITEEEARPGDLVFFEGTYNAGVPITHVGIYAGDGVMLHAGDPISFTSFKTDYWQKHNPTFGRLTQD